MLSKGKLSPVWLGKGLHTSRARGRKTTRQFIFNNPRYSILPGSAPDPIVIKVFKNIYMMYINMYFIKNVFDKWVDINYFLKIIT